jgi:hypothetical protein
MTKVKSNALPVKSGLENGNTKVSFSPAGRLLRLDISSPDGGRQSYLMSATVTLNAETATFTSTEISLLITRLCKQPTAKKSLKN